MPAGVGPSPVPAVVTGASVLRRMAPLCSVGSPGLSGLRTMVFSDTSRELSQAACLGVKGSSLPLWRCALGPTHSHPAHFLGKRPGKVGLCCPHGSALLSHFPVHGGPFASRWVGGSALAAV